MLGGAGAAIYFAQDFSTEVSFFVIPAQINDECVKFHTFQPFSLSVPIYVINFKKASGRFFFHFLEVFEKCVEYIGIFFIHFREISKFW